MFGYLGEKLFMSDTNIDVYRCEFWFIFSTMYVCFVLFLIDVTAIKHCDVMCPVCRTFDCRNNDYVTMSPVKG